VVNYIYDTLVVSVPALCAGVADELILVFYDTDSDSGEKVLERFVVAFDVSSVVEASRILGGEGEDAADCTDRHGHDHGDGGVLSREAIIVQAKVQELQRGLRDVLLKIISLEGSSSALGRKRGQANFTGTTTFKLCLHCSSETTTTTTDTNTDTNLQGDGVNEDFMLTDGEDLLQKCPELCNAMQDGKWFKSDTSSCHFGQDTSSELNCNDKTGASKNKPYGVTRPIKSINVPSCGLKMQLLMECEA